MPNRLQRLIGRLAGITPIPPGRPNDGLTPLTSPPATTDKPWGELTLELAEARTAWRNNPLARRLVGMVTAYVVGNGITLRTPDPSLQAFIDAFWQDNQLDQRIPDWCDELTRAGEIFPILFTNPLSRRSTVRTLPASTIERIEWRPGDYEAELRFKQLSHPGDPTEHWWLSPLHPAAADLSTPLMLHYAVNRPTGALRGESDLAPILPWLRRYSSWLEDRCRLNSGVRAFLWIVKAPATLRTALAEKYRRPPESGSVIIAEENESWQAVAPSLHAADAANDGRALRWMIVAGGPGTSLLDLGEGEDSNLATGQVMTEMRRRFLRRRQAYLAWLLTDLTLTAWHRFAGPASPLSPADITPILPDISVEDNQRLAQAAMQLATGLNTMGAMVGGTDAYKQMALRLFIKFAGEQITEQEIAAMLQDTSEDS